MKAAVIGAGIAGLHLARSLHSEGVTVHVFDKARGPSGRLATRRTDEAQFDHGAQYFTARAQSFVSQVEDWQVRGVVARWNSRIVRLDGGEIEKETAAPDRYVGVPRMSAIARDLADGLRADFSSRVVSVNCVDGRWVLEIEEGQPVGDFDVVVTAAPAPQAVPLLASSPALAERAAAIRMLPCDALMVRFESELDVEFDAAFVKSSPLGWIARNSSKPERTNGPAWVLHATAAWSEAHLDLAPEQTRDALLTALEAAIGGPLPAPRFFAAHRWLYARPEARRETAADPDGEAPPLWDAETGIGACGDWVRGDRVEDAFLSAEPLARAILDR